METATDVCAVAVSRDGVLLVEVTLDEPRRHAERLVPMVDEALTSAGVSPADLTAVAVSAGPGSYTGLRIGASTAKGVAFALSIPLVPVPSLQALAASVEVPAGTLVVAAFGARRGEVYAQSFRACPDTPPAPLAGPLAGSPGEVLPILLPAAAPRSAILIPSAPAEPGRLYATPAPGNEDRSSVGAPDGPPPRIVFVGDGADLLARIADEMGLAYEARTHVRPTAAAVARLAEALLAAGASVDADAFEPYYLREFTAKLASGSMYDRLPT